MTDERYRQIMADLGMPDSRSLLAALQQVANEVAQETQAAAVAMERERVSELAQLAVSYAKDADWSRVTAVLGLIDRQGA